MKTVTTFLLATLLLPLIIVAQSDSTKAAQHYVAGEQHYHMGNIDSSYYYFEIARDLFTPANQKGYGLSIYKIALLERNQGRYSNAIEVLEEVREIGQNLAEKENDWLLLTTGLREIGYSYLINKDYFASNRTLKQLIKISKQDFQNGRLMEASAYALLIWNYTQTGGFDSAVYYSNKALVTADILRNDTTRSYEIVTAISNTYSGVGNYYGRIGHSPNYEKYHIMQYDFLVSEYGKGHRLLMQPLLGLGNLAFINSNHSDALDYYDKALFIAKAYKDSTSDRYAQIHDKLRQIYSELEEWEKALYHNEKAMRVYKNKEHLKLNLYKSFAVKSNIMAITGDHSEAEKFFQLANEAFDKESDDYYLNTIAIILVGSLSERGKIQEATNLSKKALSLGKTLFPERSFELSQNYHALANLTMKSSDLSSSYKFLDSARVANTREDSTQIYTQINIDIHALEISLLKKELNRKPLDISKTIDIIKDGQEYVSAMKSNLESDLGQIYEPNLFYNNGAELCALLYQETSDPRFFELLFQLTENDRSFDLKRYIRKADMLSSADIPEKLENERKNFLDALITLKYEIKNSSELSSKAELALREKYKEAKSQYENVIVNLKEESPAYYQYNYQVSNTSLEDLEFKLNGSNSMLISYYATDSVLIALGLDGVNRTIEMIPWTEDLKSDIISFRNMLNSPETNEYMQLSQRVSSALLKAKFSSMENKNLIILPHDILNYIPFELLSSNDDGSFLFESNLINYEYSAETFMKSNPTKGSDMLAMSPQFQSANQIGDVVRSELAALPGAAREVQELSEVMSAKTIVGLDATESVFKGLAKNYGVLHMATHAIVDDNNPDNTRLIFSLKKDSLEDGYLNAYEIYNLDLNAQLVTLSACNTGFGKIKKGEGVMSLSRAFAYAGVPATVVSLWPASDKSTPELMKYFYQNLKDGQAKDVALNNARKQYLSTAKGKARHPFYWGGFVLIGDNQPLKSTSNNMLWIFLIVVVIGVVGIATLRKNRVRN